METRKLSAKRGTRELAAANEASRPTTLPLAKRAALTSPTPVRESGLWRGSAAPLQQQRQQQQR